MTSHIVRPPWATIDDCNLGVKVVSARSKEAEQYNLQAPWTKAGNNAEEEMKQVREALDVRTKRRVENATRDRALRNLSKDSNNNMVQRTQAYRKQRKSDVHEDTEVQTNNRRESIETASKNHKKIHQERREQEKVERQRAQEEARLAVERKREMLSREKSAVTNERAAAVAVGAKICQSTASLQRQRKVDAERERIQHAEEFDALKTAAAQNNRKERIQEEKDAKRIREDHKYRKQVRAAWVLEEKEESSFKLEQAIRERAEMMQQRRLAGNSTKDFENQRQNAEKQEREESKCRQRSLKETERQAWASEREAHQEEILLRMEDSQLRASERRRLERKARKERLEEPLRRRAQFGRDRKAQELAEKKAYDETVARELSQRRERRATNVQADKKARKQPIVLG